MSEEERKVIQKPRVISRIALVAGIVTFLCGLLIVPFAIFFVCGCGLMPHFEYREAKSLVPSVREYALSNLQDLSEEERDFILQTEPVIGHANYMIYYYWWKNKDGETLFCVESSPPSTGIKPTTAYRVNVEEEVSPYR